MKSSAPALSRRRFLLAAGAGGVATAAVSTGKNPSTQPRKVEEARSGKGYHVTEHIRKYYNTTKV